jgi:hypothetical protein
MNKKLIRLTESDLHKIVKESVNRVLKEAQLNELDPRTYASLANKRDAQGQNYKAAKARQAARDAWNKQYGYNYDNGKDGYGYMKMGGADQFTHNASSNYGISAQHGNKEGTQNYAYNPQKGTEWHGNGKGDSYTQKHEYDPGDNGAHRVADEMENGNGVYQNGKWQ